MRELLKLRDISYEIMNTLIFEKINTTVKQGDVIGIIQSIENKNYSFCDIYHFSNAGKNAKIQRISTYINNFSMEPTNVCYN